MSCTGCTTKFTFFTKEYSCENCLLSFCANCLKQKLIVNGAKKRVCATCFRKSNVTEEGIDVPALLLKRLESLEDPARPPVTVFRANPMESLKRGLSEKDMELAERLEKLKERGGPQIPSETEIKKRLQDLKGLPVASMSKPAPVPFPKTKVEQADDLMKQFLEEMALSGPDSVSDLEARLAALKGGKPQEKKSAESESEDESDAVNRLVQRAVDEAALPRTGESTPSDEQISPPSNEPELPWCELCNEDATLICISCDDALYCKRCFKEAHEDDDMKSHRTKPLEAKKKSL